MIWIQSINHGVYHDAMGQQSLALRCVAHPLQKVNHLSSPALNLLVIVK